MELNLDWRRVTSDIWPEVVYEIRPLKVWAFQDLLRFWEENGRKVEGDNSTISVTPPDGIQLMDVAKRIFPDHVRELKGLTLVQEGHPSDATLDSLCEETPLMHLAGEIISRLVAISEIEKGEEKN